MRTLQELRNMLLDIIPEIKSGSIEVSKANAICSTTNSIINLTKLEMDYNGIQGDKPSNDFILEPKNDVLAEISLNEKKRNEKPYEFGK